MENNADKLTAIRDNIKKVIKRFRDGDYGSTDGIDEQVSTRADSLITELEYVLLSPYDSPRKLTDACFNVVIDLDLVTVDSKTYEQFLNDIVRAIISS